MRRIGSMQARVKWERDSYAVLLHVATLVAAGLRGVALEEIASKLALDEREAEAYVGWLSFHGLLLPVGGGRCSTLGARGAHYLQVEAGRRRSVRFAVC